MFLSALFLVHWLIHLITTVCSASSNIITLKTIHSTLRLDSATGSLLSLSDVSTGEEFVQITSTTTSLSPTLSIFRLSLVNRTFQPAGSINAAEFRHITVTQPPSQLAAIFTFRGHPSFVELQCVVSFRVESVDGTFRAGLNCSSLSSMAIRVASFPQFDQPSKLKSPDSIAMPWYEGIILNDPGFTTSSYNSTFSKATNSNGEKFPWTQYPGFAAYQFMARYSNNAGLFMATYDSLNNVKQFDFAASAGEYVRLSINHLQGDALGSPLILPYDIALRTYDPHLGTFASPRPRLKMSSRVVEDWGGWREAGHIYKDWTLLEKTLWTRTLLTERIDFPEMLLNGTAAMIVNLCPSAVCEKQGYDSVTYGKNLELLVPMYQQYKRDVGLKHVIAVVFGWEHLGVWAGLGYFPPKPSAAAWSAASSEFKKNGDAAALLLSGYWMVKEREATEYGSAFNQVDLFKRLQQQHAFVTTSSGSPASMDYRNQTRASHHGLSFRLCHGADQAQKTMSDVVKRANAFASIVSFDQEMGGGADFSCHDESHGHPPGRGSWEMNAYVDQLDQMLKSAKNDNRTLSIMQEQVSEPTIPVVSIYWSRQFWQLASQGADASNIPGLNILNVGIFSYMFHEFALSMGAAQYQGQGSIAREPFELRSLVIMSCVARGLMPAPFGNDVFDPTFDTWHARVYEANVAANKAWAAWAFGILASAPSAPSPLVKGPMLETYEFVQEDQRRNISLPAVQVGTWVVQRELVMGRQSATQETGQTRPSQQATIATMLLNPTWDVVSVEVTLEWRLMEGGASNIELHNGTNRSVIKTWPALTKTVVVQLPSLGSAMLLVHNVSICGMLPC